jgi:Zn-dependent protease with chaperone function
MKKLVVLFLLVLWIPRSPLASGARPPRMPDAFKQSLDYVVELSKHYEILDDHPDLDRMNRIGYALVRQVDDPDSSYSFQIIRMRDPNAFTLPGGFIFVTSGILDLHLTDPELAALLGHEIIHAAHKHSEKMQKKQTLLSALSNLAILGAIFGMKDSTPKSAPQQSWVTLPDSQIDKMYGYETPKQNVLEAAVVFAAVFQELLLEGYSRDYELEADRDGTYLAAQAGFDPRGAVDLMEGLRKRIYEAPGYGYWRSHPYFDDRHIMAQERVKQLNPSGTPADIYGTRLQTQERMHAFALAEKNPQRRKILDHIALQVNDRGLLSFTLHLDELKALRDEKLARPFSDRDYGAVEAAMDRVLDQFQDDQEAAAGVAALKDDRALLAEEKEGCHDTFAGVLRWGVPSTDFLKNFMSNYPKDPEAPLAALLLATSRFRVEQEEEGARALETVVQDGDPLLSEAAEAAARNVLPHLHSLGACYRLSVLFKDSWTGAWARQRLEVLLPQADSLRDVRSFLDDFPDADLRPEARARLEKLAQGAYVKGKVLERVGDKQRAMDMYNTVLESAPESPTAEKIRKDILNETMLKEGGLS